MANSFLNAFERSFESFLSHKFEENTPEEAKNCPPFQVQAVHTNQRSLSSVESISSLLRESSNLHTDSYRNSAKKTFSSENSLPKSPLMTGSYSPRQDIRFKCGSCPKSFRQSCHLVEHEMIHTGDFPFFCDLCRRGFRREAAFDSHKCVSASSSSSSSSTPTAQKSFKCDDCLKSYSSKQSFQLHKCHSSQERFTKSQPLHHRKRHVEEDDDDVLEIHVQVSVVTSDIQICDTDNAMMITGDIIKLDNNEVTLEEAFAEGYEVEMIDDSKTVLVDEEPAIKNSTLNIAEAYDQFSKDSGIDLVDIEQTIDYFLLKEIPTEKSEVALFPWQQQKEEPNVVMIDSSSSVSLDESHDSRSSSVNTLQEQVTPAPAPQQSKMREPVSMKKFTYFNDEAAIDYNASEDDTDDEDWSLKEKCNACKKEFSSKTQLKKHSKLHKESNKKSKDKMRADSNSSILLVEDDDEVTKHDAPKATRLVSERLLEYRFSLCFCRTQTSSLVLYSTLS